MRPQAPFGGQALYTATLAKATALMHSLPGKHPFINGNKRTAATSTGIFLELNGDWLNASNHEFEAFVLAVVTKHLGAAEIEDWIGHNTVVR